MGSQVAEKTGSSLESPSKSDDAKKRVEIVPGRDRSDVSNDDSATHSADLPFLGDQHETIVSKQRPGSSERLSLDAALAHSALNPNEMGAVLKGETLGHFLLEEFVGGGGMGVVFRATDIRLGRTVAIKILTRDRTDADTLRRFQNEAQSAARLDHENIARVYYVGEDRGLHFIVFEFIEGTNIRDLVQRQGPLPVDQAISYVLQVAEALEHASMRNVIHRDIKPSNVLVTDSGIAKLVDMGLARLHQMESDTDDLTASGVTLGTFDYISPEQARDPRTADVRSDLYSLGCTFYFMLTGRPPFPEGTVLQKLLSHSTEEPTDPRMFRPDLDDQIVQTLQRLLAKQPSHRYQRASELISHLLLVAERLNLEPIARNPHAWNSPRHALLAMVQRVLPWSLPILLLIVSILLLQNFWGSSESFEFGGPTIRLQTSQVEPPVEQSSEPSASEPMESATIVAQPTTRDPASGDRAVVGDSLQDSSPAEQPAAEQPVAEQPVAEQPLDGSLDRELPTDGQSELPSTGTTGDPSSEMVDDRQPRDTGSPDRAQDLQTGDVPTVGERSEPAAAIGAQPGPSVPVESMDEPPVGTSTPPGEPSARLPSELPGGGQAKLERESGESNLRAQTTLESSQEYNRIVVADEPGGWAEDVLPVTSLAAACREAQRLGVKRIELHFDGPREETTLDIATPELTISSGIGYRPLIVFRPTDDADPSGHAAMIHASGSRLIWHNVQIFMDLTEASSQSWSLFRLHSYVGLELLNSVLTIRNVDPQGDVRHPLVAFVALEARPSGWSDNGRKPPIPYYVNLTDTMLRGQATVVRADQATAFRLYAQNSLIVTRNFLTDVDGSSSRPSLRDGRIDIVLRHVTIAARMGLVRMAVSTQAPYQLDLFTDIADSILMVTDDRSPLFQRMGIHRIEAVDDRLDLRGRDNFYPGSTKFLRLGPDLDTDQTADVDVDRHDQMPFLKERSPHLTLIWQGLPGLGLSEERHLPGHYELERSEFNPAFRLGDEPSGGAAISRLPEPIDIPSFAQQR